MSCKLIDYHAKFIRDSMKQLRNGKMIFVLNASRKQEIEQAIDREGLSVTRTSHLDHWSYQQNKEETK